MNKLKWLYPGMRIKRWIFLSVLGATLFGAGLVLVSNAKATTLLKIIYFTKFNPAGPGTPQGPGIFLLVVGLMLIVVGFRNTISSIIKVLAPEKQDDVAEFIYQKHHLKRGPKVVVMGGGTGLSVLLRGLKKYTSNITAVVTVADDGGSSGKLRGEFGILPPGDIRNCLVALADKETLMEELFQHRFSNGHGLVGHSMGNLLIAAMTQIAGDFEAAIREMSKVLAIRGQVLPATLKHCCLCAELEDGSIIEGESEIPRTGKHINRVFLKPGDCEPVPEALEAIAGADIIILGPGSLYTSIIPNLLIKGVADAISRASAATVYVCNIMTQPGETEAYKASDHIRAIHQHAGSGLIDYAVVNVEDIPKSLVRKYREDGAEPVRADVKEIERMNVHPVKRNLVFESDVVRHDPEKLAESIMELIGELKLGHDKFFIPNLFAGKPKHREM
ncbi:MAG: gluconeogenesis factor YvcK family protein [Eubacteriales bacterium]